MIFKKKKFCANCGSEMASEDKFCSNCGTHELKATNQVGNNLVATFNPGTAFLISIYTTGAGHIYLGLFKRGISFLISQIVLVVLVAIFTLLLGYLWYMLAVIVLLLGILACLTLHIYSIYDSYKSIKKIKRFSLMDFTYRLVWTVLYKIYMFFLIKYQASFLYTKNKTLYHYITICTKYKVILLSI